MDGAESMGTGRRKLLLARWWSLADVCAIGGFFDVELYGS